MYIFDFELLNFFHRSGFEKQIFWISYLLILYVAQLIIKSYYDLFLNTVVELWKQNSILFILDSMWINPIISISM